MNPLQTTKHFLILLGFVTIISIAALFSCDNMMEKTNEASDTNIKNSELCIDTITVTVPGSVKAYMGEVEPKGWLECNGQELQKSEYPDLYSAIGDIYGDTGDSTTFKLPDLRGVFLRGWDHGRGLDPDSASRTDRGDGITGDFIGTYQEDIFASHTHRYDTLADPDSNVGGTGPVWSDTTTKESSATGGSETRPKNINVMYIISVGQTRQVIVPCEQ